MTPRPDRGPGPHRPTHSPLWPLALVVALLGGLVVDVPVVRASTTEASVASSIARLIDRDRSWLGLRSYGVDSTLASIARGRAKAMADARTLSHSVGGNLRAQLDGAGVTWRSMGEAVGYTTTPWGPDVAGALYRMWKASATHWRLITSRDFNRIGIGVARASNGATYASIVFIDSPRGSGVKTTPKPTPKPKPTPEPTPRPTTEVAADASLPMSIRIVDPWRGLGGPLFGRPMSTEIVAVETPSGLVTGILDAMVDVTRGLLVLLASTVDRAPTR